MINKLSKYGGKNEKEHWKWFKKHQRYNISGFGGDPNSATNISWGLIKCGIQ